MQRLEIAMYSIEQQDIIVDMLESFDSLINQYKIKEQLMTDIFKLVIDKISKIWYNILKGVVDSSRG